MQSGSTQLKLNWCTQSVVELPSVDDHLHALNSLERFGGVALPCDCDWEGKTEENDQLFHGVFWWLPRVIRPDNRR